MRSGEGEHNKKSQARRVFSSYAVTGAASESFRIAEEGFTGMYLELNCENRCSRVTQCRVGGVALRSTGKMPTLSVFTAALEEGLESAGFNPELGESKMIT